MDNTNVIKGLTVGQLIDTLEIGQVGVVINNLEGAILPPTGVFWDEFDMNKMKYIYPDGGVADLYGIAKTNNEGSRFKILDSIEDYFEYVDSFYSNTNEDEGV